MGFSKIRRYINIESGLRTWVGHITWGLSAKLSYLHCCLTGDSSLTPGGQINIKMWSYQYRKSHCGDKTIWRPFYLHNGISYTGKMTSLYWIRALTATSCSWFQRGGDTEVTPSVHTRCQSDLHPCQTSQPQQPVEPRHGARWSRRPQQVDSDEGSPGYTAQRGQCWGCDRLQLYTNTSGLQYLPSDHGLGTRGNYRLHAGRAWFNGDQWECW